MSTYVCTLVTYVYGSVKTENTMQLHYKRYDNPLQ